MFANILKVLTVMMTNKIHIILHHIMSAPYEKSFIKIRLPFGYLPLKVLFCPKPFIKSWKKIHFDLKNIDSLITSNILRKKIVTIT